MRFQGVVLVQPKEGIADPEGSTIYDAAGALGYSGVVGVRAGRSFIVDVDANDEEAARRTIMRLGEELLTNPVIQRFSVLSVDVA
ncbi:MAG: phosphoribosylformylglycinamidine synthase subunit PurS [Ferrimicrobium sp.]